VRNAVSTPSNCQPPARIRTIRYPSITRPHSKPVHHGRKQKTGKPNPNKRTHDDDPPIVQHDLDVSIHEMLNRGHLFPRFLCRAAAARRSLLPLGHFWHGMCRLPWVRVWVGWLL
jgi:hypothetical protein